MAGLADLPNLIGFFSYSREDDEGDDGAIAALADRIYRELRAQLGRTSQNFKLWRDKDALSAGEHWKSKLKEAVAESAFFIQMVSPSAVKSPYCRFELESFLEREKELKRDDLFFPILYISVPELNDGRKDNDEVLSIISEREYADWRKIRHGSVNSPEVRQTVEQFCNTIAKKLRDPWNAPEEQDRVEEQDAGNPKRRGVDLAASGSEQEARAIGQSLWTHNRIPLDILRRGQWFSRGRLLIIGAVLAVLAYLLLATADWLSIRDSLKPEDFQHHLTTYPLSPFTPLAHARLTIINEWSSIKDSMEPADYQRYLATYPSSPFASLARGRLAGLDEKDTTLRSRKIEDVQEYTNKYPESLYRPFADLRLKRLQAVASGKNFTAVLLPDSSQRFIRPEEIQPFDCTRLWRGRNEMYYAVGYCFSSQDAISEFSQTAAECHHDNCKVFKNLQHLAEDVLNNFEQANIATIKARETEARCRLPREIKGICTQ
jgi:TIR domain/YARHG domain